MYRTAWAALLLCLILSACTGVGSPAPTATLAVAASASPQATVTDTRLAPTSAMTPVVPRLIFVPWQLEMIDTNHGWGIGALPYPPLQRVLRTADGGQTWQDVTPPERAADAGSPAVSALAVFWGAERAWVLYFAPAPVQSSEAFFTYHTTDGGVTWQAGEALDLDNLMMDFFLPGGMGFSDENNGWLLAHLGAGMNHDYVAIFKTSDAGKTWARVVEPPQGQETANALPMRCAKTGLTFLDAQTGWVAGNCQGVVDGVYLYRTQDGGVSWQLVELPAPAGQLALQNQQNACGAQPPVFNGQNGYLSVTCAGADLSYRRFLYRSDDGGETWSAAQMPSTFGDLTLTPAGSLLVLGWDAPAGVEARTLFASADEGQSWDVRLADIAWNGELDFVDQRNGWARVVQQDETVRLLRTRDGGQTWEALSPVLAP